MSTVRPYDGPGKYPVRVYVGVDPLTGRHRRRSITFEAKSKRDYDRQRRRVEDQLDAEREGLAASGTVAELVDDWLALAERDRSPSTLRSYRPRVKLIRDRFGTMPAVDLRARDIDQWYTALMTETRPAGVHHGRGRQATFPKSASYIHELHRVFGAILNFGVAKDRLPKAVTRQVTLPEYHQPDIKPPDDRQALAIFAALPDVPWGRAVQLLLATGMRRGEVVGLRWEDWHGNTLTVRHSIVEVKGGRVVVKEPKGKRTRVVTLGATGQAILERQRVTARPGPWVFGDGNGGPARPGWISTMWNRWRTNNGAAGVRVHDIRHWYATHALEHGATVASVAAQLGHAQASTTQNLYHARTDAGRQQVADAIDRGLMTPERVTPLTVP